MRYGAIIILLILAISVCGCGFSKALIAPANRYNLSSLQVGMTKDQVISTMGRPYKKEAHEDKEYFFYVTEWIPFSEEEAEELTPLVFENNKLVGWGKEKVKVRLQTSP